MIDRRTILAPEKTRVSTDNLENSYKKSHGNLSLLQEQLDLNLGELNDKVDSI
jgi:hypothetical protein